MAELFGFIGVIFLIVLYCLPGLVANYRRHHDENAIIILNLFLGWTMIGWLVALIWANTAVRNE